MFTCERGSTGDLCVKSLVEAGDVKLLYASPTWSTPGSFLPGDRSMMFFEQDPQTQKDIKILSLDGQGEPRVFLKTPADEDNPEASRDGGWVAYTSNETGRGEVYVRASSGNYQQWQISSAGGSQPRWRADGKELFYLARDGNVMSAAIEVSPVFRPGTPKALFKLPTTPDRDTPVFEDVTPDGQRMLLNVPVTELSSVGFDVILNWSELLKTKE